MQFNITQLNNQERYRLLNGGVTPRPIAWVSTRSSEGIDNLAPYSFFSVASCTPPVLMFTTVMPRDGQMKDSLVNIKETKACVINIVSEPLMAEMNATSASFDANISEFERVGIQTCESQSVPILSVAQAPIRYECTLRDIVTISEQPGGGTIALLDVKSVFVQDEILDNGIISQSLLNSVGRMGGSFFCKTNDLVEADRPL